MIGLVSTPGRWAAVLIPSILACDTPDTTPVTEAVATWVTEADHEIGELLAGDAVFARVDHVRVGDDGRRVFVLESGTGRVSVWTVNGVLQKELGGIGDGPGEFAGAETIKLLEDGFYVRDSRRYTVFADDGTVVKTVPHPPSTLSYRGFRLAPRLLLPDGGFLAVPQLPSMVTAGWLGDDPVHELPVFHLSFEGNSWNMDTTVVLDIENQGLSIGSLDRPLGNTVQPWGDADQAHYDPRTGTVVVVRTSVTDGRVQLLEVAPAGDTVWALDLLLEPVPLLRQDVQTQVDRLEQSLSAIHPAAARRDIRRAVEDALFVPDFHPSVDYRIAMTRGELWLKTFETAEVDTLTVWYSVTRGEARSIRKVLLPETFLPRDVTDRHVWGVRLDSMGVNYVAGRRLVRVSAPG